MEATRGIAYRLAPTPDQEKLLQQAAGACRLVYNLALEQRRDHGRRFRERTGRHLDFFFQKRDLTALRSEYPIIRAASVDAQQRALKHLDDACRRHGIHRVRFRKKGLNESFGFAGRGVSIRRISRRWSEVRLPKIGWVRYRDTRPHGEIREATVRLTPLGWQLSLTCRVEVDHKPAPFASVGVDRGVAVPLMLSTGEPIRLPGRMMRLERQRKRAQRTASRRRRGSKRWAKAMRRANAIQARGAGIRRHWQHVTTTNLARRYRTVAIENLRTQAMTRRAHGVGASQKRGLNRGILNVGWYAVETMLTYKLAERGGTLIKVDPAYTSQTCSDCGAVDKRSRESQAVFVCCHCGFRANADHNAAINIERRGNAAVLDVEEGHWLSDEASTRRAILPGKTAA